VTLSHEKPPRLICVRCGRPQPIKPGPTPYQRLTRNLRHAVLLALLLAMPLAVLLLSASLDQQPDASSQQRSRLGKVTTGRTQQRHDAKDSSAGRR